MSTAPAPRDRRQRLLEEGALFGLNGIDYVDVAADQTRLFVHFLNGVAVPGSPDGLAATIAGGPAATTVPIGDPAGWSMDSEGRQILTLAVAGPGDFSTYTLTIPSPLLDPFFQSVTFTFQAACASTLDSAAPAPGGPAAPAGEQVPIDYLAKDFGSFRQALSDFSTSRYPLWVERSEADLGVVLMEALAAIADELSYYQDRVAAESTLMTATQRLSVLRHARLVAYEPTPATTATTVLQLEVNSPRAGTSWTITTPLLFQALAADGSVVSFEIEDPATGLAGGPGAPAGAPPAWATVDTRWNRASLRPYYLDDSQRTLAAGSTGLYLTGVGLGLYPGQQLLLDTSDASTGDPPVRELVTVADTGAPVRDQLFGQVLTPVRLAAPTTADHDLSGTEVAGNIVPAVQGMRQTESFSIPGPDGGPYGPVVVRRAAADQAPGDDVPDLRYCLASGPLAWLAAAGQDAPGPARPEIVLTPDGAKPWTFQRRLLDAGPSDPVYTLTPEQYSPVLTSGGRTWYDYDGDGGTTIRFGDGTFGDVPPPDTRFTVLYRVGGGAAGNVPADTIVTVAPGQPQAGVVSASTNPFPASGGTDAETIAQVRARAPQAFRVQPLRVVQPADYVAAAQSLPWVQQAGTTFRWTGSWLTVLTSANPKGAEEPSMGQFADLTGLLGRRRLAGYESYALAPRYVSIDLQVAVCGQPTAFASQVRAAVLARLQPGALPGGGAGFFDHSQWGFGQPLESSALLAAVQSCPGVAGVTGISYRRRGLSLSWAPLPDTLIVGADQILRVDNDPARPDAGSLQVTVEGAR